MKCIIEMLLEKVVSEKERGNTNRFVTLELLSPCDP